jgi:hypothetical protein
MRSIPSTSVHGTEKLGEAAAEVAAVGVDVLAEERDLADALTRETRDLRQISPGRLLTSRPRTDGTMQYEQTELQPIETCTHAWKRRSRCIGSVPANSRSSAIPKLPRGASPPAPSHSARCGNRARPERDVDERVEVEEPLALRLGVAAADRDHLRRVGSFSIFAFPRCAANRWSGFSRIVQVLKTSTSASSWETALPRPELLEHALDALRSRERSSGSRTS